MISTVLIVIAAGWIAACAGAPVPPFPLDYVDPRIGTGSLAYGIGHLNPGAQHPFAPLRLGPDTDLDGVFIQFNHYSGYYWRDTHIRSFSHTHMVGAGLPDYGSFGLMPVRVAVPTPVLVRDYNYRSPFNHTSEIMFPGYYSVVLDGPSVTAELTAAGTHAGVHRYDFSGGAGARTLLLNVCHSVDRAQTCYDARVNITIVDGAAHIRASLRHRGNLTGRNGRGIDIWSFLVVRSTAALVGWGVWQDGAVLVGASAGEAATSASLGVYLYFGDGTVGGPDNVVTVEAGISFVSAAHAEANLNAQLGPRSFDTALADTTELWRTTLLGTLVTAAAPRTSDLTKLYTAVYRTFMSPTIFSEWDGTYIGMDDALHQVEPGHQYYSDLSLWDTYRTQNPWLVLVRGDVALDIARSIGLMVEHGGDLPRWPIANVYTNCMFGDNANMVLLDTYVKGLPDFNITVAYEAMRANALGPRPRDGRGGIEQYIQYGFVPLEASDKGTSDTLAYAYNDWALARLAEILGRDADAAAFDQRALNYRNAFDPVELFMCPRWQNGTFACPPYINFPYHPNYVEGNAWHYTWDVPHDLSGMLALWPSTEVFLAKLEENFVKSTQQPDIFENNFMPNPFYWAGNEHNLLFPWVFHAAGRPDRSHYWTRFMLDRRYSDQPSGLPGNDDYGTMSAWFAFTALGFYPLTGHDFYFVGSPLVSQATVGLGNGRNFSVTAIDQSPENVFVERIELNGEPFTSAYVTHAQLTSGSADFVFYMTSNPDTPYYRANDGARVPGKKAV